MTVRKMILTAALGFGLIGTAAAQDKTSAAKAQNQKLADAVAETLKSSGVMKGAKVEIEARSGVVDITGTVATAKQHEAILRALTKVPGIVRIDSGLTVAGEPVQAPASMTAMVQAPTAPTMNMVERTAGQVEGPGAFPPGAGGGFGPMPTNEPVPLNGQPMMGPLDPAGPRLPPHAWPTYAPYNNFSRVAYPQSYPYNAFPYIGPYYPFPKVPLGWRKVVLEWEDGHWYYGRIASPHDQWRVKFW